MSRAEQYINNYTVRVDKISKENNLKFLTRIGYCLANAKTSTASWRLYQAATIKIHYIWMQYLDEIGIM